MKGSPLLTYEINLPKGTLKIRYIFLGVFTLLMALIISSCGGDETNKKEIEKKPEIKIQAKQETPVPKGNYETGENGLGKRVFILCTSCHNLKKDEPHKVGPNLHGIFGRKAGTNEGFKYSEALIQSGITWDENTITKWIENPDEYIPGSNMAFVGVKNKKQQDAVIQYIMEETKK